MESHTYENRAFRQEKIKQLYQMQQRNQKTETEKHPWGLALKGSSVISARVFLMISDRGQTTEGKMRMKDQQDMVGGDLFQGKSE